MNCEGSVHALFLYDVADELRLPALQAIVGAGRRERALEFRLPAPAYVRLSRPPVIAPVEPVRLPGGEQFSTTVKYFDHGVIVVDFETRFSSNWEELGRCATNWMNAPDLEQYGLQIAQREADRVRGAMVNPYGSWLDEIYGVVHLRSVQDDEGRALTGAELLRRYGGPIAQIVRGETMPLAEAEQREVLGSSLSYYPNDLMVLGWLAAVVYDTPEGFAPVLQLLEYANVQLLEFRHYDNVLSSVLDEAYDSLERRRGLFSGWRLAKEARRLDTLRLDTAELAERTENSIKFLSDMFYARAFQVASARVGAMDYRHLVEEKLRTAGELYQSMVNEFRETRSFLLEVTVVVILLVEIVPLIFWKR